jgi:DNA-binding transcriptional ArsR family regulator
MWPLLADALRMQPLDMSGEQVVAAFRSMDDRTFQCDVLGGLFKREGVPEALIEGGINLRQAVLGETTGAKMLEVIGLRPFQASNSIATAIQRVISDPGAHRKDVANAVERFWGRVFAEVWRSLEPSLNRRAEAIENAIRDHSLGWMLGQLGFPITIDERRRLVSGVKGPLRIPFAKLGGIELFPSAFNFLRFWTTYDHEDKKTLYFPVLHPEHIPLPSGGREIRGKRREAREETTTATVTAAHREIPAISADEAKAGFAALGDKTRFAMAVMLARSPQTSVELARAFGVSKPTISHHVQLFRAAGLLTEKSTADGVVLSIDREKLESLSQATAKVMFEGREEPTVQRTRTK